MALAAVARLAKHLHGTSRYCRVTLTDTLHENNVEVSIVVVVVLGVRGTVTSRHYYTLALLQIQYGTVYSIRTPVAKRYVISYHSIFHCTPFTYDIYALYKNATMYIYASRQRVWS